MNHDTDIPVEERAPLPRYQATHVYPSVACVQRPEQHPCGGRAGRHVTGGRRCSCRIGRCAAGISPATRDLVCCPESCL